MKYSAIPSVEIGAASLFPKTDIRFWKNRLIRRRYTEAIKFVGEPGYSTRIEHDKISFFFPLGSDDEHEAAAKAVEIWSRVVDEGWRNACERFPREITVAVFWSWNPLACTYTTLYSMPAAAPKRAGQRRSARRRACRVCVIEPEEGVRRALEFWINCQPGFECSQTARTVKEAVGASRTEGAHLILLNRDLVERPGGERLETIQERFRSIPIFNFGVYEESNYIFHSVTGVPTGYFLCRRLPKQLFDPISEMAREPKLSSKVLTRQVEKYFQSLFDLAKHEDKEQEFSNLTDREHEILICLSKGFTDKQIADALNISAWTVHGHVKKVFEKLGVHSRTEAVIKFLQK